MANAYNSPGVVVSETINAPLAPPLANPSIVAVVGSAKGEETASERLILTNLDTATLAQTGVQVGSVVVKNASTGLTNPLGTYVIVQGTDPNAAVTGDEPYTIARREHPATAPSVAATGTGALTGTYEYAVAYLNADGETGIGPASAGVPISGAGYNLTAIPVGGAGVTGRTVYRRKTAGAGADSVWHLIATIGNNSATTLSNEATSDVTAGTAPEPKNGIASGDTVIVTYDYTDDQYFLPTLFADFDDVVDKYGPAFDSNGNIDSELSFAARLIFLNGASELIAVASASASTVDVEAALSQLENEPDVRIVVAADGSASITSALSTHVSTMSAAGLYRIAVAGRDGSATQITAATMRAAAQSLNAEGLRMASPSSFRMQNPVSGAALNVGGQYMAAALAGMYAARDVQFPLTRKNVSGFIGVNDHRTASEQALDSAAGLLVIEDRGGILRVRHDITTAVGSINTRESSVVRAKYDMAHRVRTVLDAGVVGLVVSQDRAPLVVQSVVTGVLEQLLVEGTINGYGDVKARTLAGDPSTVEVRFQYTPAYPINNIDVRFTINTSTGEFTAA